MLPGQATLDTERFCGWSMIEMRQTWSSEPAVGNAGIVFRLASGRDWPGVPGPWGRPATHYNYGIGDTPTGLFCCLGI